MKTLYEKASRWKPIYARQPRREIFYIGVEKCVPMIEMEKKQVKINYATNQVSEEIFVTILNKASQILNRRYLRYNVHNASGKTFMGVEIEGLRYSALSMSAGEQKIFHILTTLYNAPKYSLILIDELDLLLHDMAMKELVKVISERALEKSLQVVFTTHRESILTLSDIINVRHLLSTVNKTLCFNETYPDAIKRLTGVQPKPIEVFVEDDVSAAIIRKLAGELRGARFVQIQRFGAATNCFTAVAGLLFSQQNLDNSLFVLDGDVFRTQEQKTDRLNKVITGTDELAANYKSSALAAITQFTIPENLKPEPYLHQVIVNIGSSATAEYQEIIDAARDLNVTSDSHKYLNDVIERLGWDRAVGLSKIIDLIATSEEWPVYTADVRNWLETKISVLQE